MAELKVRQLDDAVADALRARATKKGVSLEEEVRTTLVASVDARRRAYLRRAAAVRARIGATPAPKTLDAARLIRRERDTRG
jgi:plasmid stability protein